MKEDNELNKVKKDLINDIKMRQKDKIIELENAKLLKKLINNAETIKEATDIATLGTKYQPTGFHFDVRLENKENSDTIKYLKRREDLSFKDETAYGKEKFNNIKEKIDWICNNFEITKNNIESDSD